MNKQLRFFILAIWFFPLGTKAQQSFDNLIYWTQKKMLRTDMPITLGGVYFGNDLAKNLIYNSPVFKNYSSVYKPFAGSLPYGTEGAQGQLQLFTINSRDRHIKFSGSTLGEANLQGQTYLILKKNHQINFNANIYNQSFSTDRNHNKTLDLPYRLNTHFTVNYNARFKKKALQIALLNLSNREQAGLDIKRDLGNKYSDGDSLSPFSAFQNQNLSTAYIFFNSPIKVKPFWIYSQDISNSFQFKNYRESSILSINPYQAKQTSYLASSSLNTSYLKGFKTAVLATLKHQRVNEKIKDTEYNRIENSAALGVELDKYWKTDKVRNNRISQYHLHTHWRTEYNSLVGWIHSPGLRFDKDFKKFLLAAVYERNQRLPLNISENRDWLMSNRSLVISSDKPKLEQSDKFGLVLDNFYLWGRNWKCQANFYYILTKNKWVAELNPTSNEVKLYSNSNIVSDKQFYIQLNGPLKRKSYSVTLSYRYDDIRNLESGNNQSMLLIPAHTGLFNLNYKLPSYFRTRRYQLNVFKNLNINMTELIIGPQKTAFENQTPIILLTNLSLEFTRQLFMTREIYAQNEKLFYSFGVENLFNQTQTSPLIGMDQNTGFKGFNSYGPSSGRRFTFAVRWKLKKNNYSY